MPWTRLDDGFIAHPKILTLSHLAFRLHVSGLNWSVANTTDGKVPEVVLALALPMDKPKTRATAAVELEQAGLWNRNGSGWYIHDFADYQETKSQVVERRKRWADQKRGQRPSKHAESTADNPADSYEESVESPRVHADVPSHPIPIGNSHAEGLTTPRGTLRAWAKLQGTEPTASWLAKRVRPAREFLDQHPEFPPDSLMEFLTWVKENGCAEPGGWPSWWPSWPGSIVNKTLPDCAICENRRLVPLDDEWSQMAPCQCTWGTPDG